MEMLSLAAAVSVGVAIVATLLGKDKPIHYDTSRPLDAIEMQSVWGNRITDRQMSNGFHIISKKPLTFETVKKAVTIVADSQPLMRACIQSPSTNCSDPWFVPMKPMIYDIQKKDNRDWKLELENQMMIQYNEETGPLWRLVFLPNAKVNKTEKEFIHESAIILACHHGIVDGVSLMHLFSQIMSMINKIQEGETIPNLPDIKIFAPLTQVINVQGFKEKLIWKITRIFSFLLTVLPQWVIADRMMAALAVKNPLYEKHGMEMTKDSSIPDGTSILPLELSREDSDALLMACRYNGATILGAAMAATNVSMEKILLEGSSEKELNLMTMIMVNSRDFLAINVPNEALGNYAFPIFIPLKVKINQQDHFWESAKDSSCAVKGYASRKVAVISTAISYIIGNLRKDRPLIGSLMNMFSNRGNCGFLNEVHSTVKVVAQHGAVAGNAAPVCPFMHYITTVDGRMCWTIVYTRKYVSDCMAEQVGNYIVTSLLEASSCQ